MHRSEDVPSSRLLGVALPPVTTGRRREARSPEGDGDHVCAGFPAGRRCDCSVFISHSCRPLAVPRSHPELYRSRTHENVAACRLRPHPRRQAPGAGWGRRPPGTRRLRCPHVRSGREFNAPPSPPEQTAVKAAGVATRTPALLYVQSPSPRSEPRWSPGTQRQSSPPRESPALNQRPRPAGSVPRRPPPSHLPGLGVP